ncbi:MAG: aldo/keto reductase [Actinomycetota bacterium]|nr:aldo/keto reductase [Actinomycetota bacterium]
MQTRALGSTGLTVGAIGLGCMGMSWGYGEAERDDTESAAVLNRALDLGVTLIDTADAYGPFTNEELIGGALEHRRDDYVLATKCGLVHDAAAGTFVRDGRPEHVRAACDASLMRLRTDVIDLYQLHRVDDRVPLEDTWGAMAELAAAGKVRNLGMSEVTVDQLERAAGIWPVSSVQSELSLWTRDRLSDVVPWCAENGAAFIPYAPLGRGFLTGRFSSADEFAAGDFRTGNPRFTSEAVHANLAIVERVKAVATRRETSAARVALAWILAQGRHIVPIPGTKKLRYLEENAGAADVELTDADLAELDDLPSTFGDRY